MPKHIIHTTDCFHPHNDPDDHFDLALQYALAAAGITALDNVIIDHPARSQFGPYAPAANACAQLGLLSGQTVPMTVGSSVGLRRRGDTLQDTPAADRAAVERIATLLRQNCEKTALVMVGEASDIAAAVATYPALFREKCAGIYLVAGTAEHPYGVEEEWNVLCGRSAYITIFDAPCPVYWRPCFQVIGQGESYFGDHNYGENGCVLLAPQKHLLETAPPRLQAYFSYMFEKSTDPLWLDALESGRLSDRFYEEVSRDRRFYSTPAILHAAGLSADRYGNTVDPVDPAAVFAFRPIEAVCADDGIVDWHYTDRQDTNRYVLYMPDHAAYQDGMMLAMEKFFALLK